MRHGTYSSKPHFLFQQNEHARQNKNNVTVGHSEGTPSWPLSGKPNLLLTVVLQHKKSNQDVIWSVTYFSGHLKFEVDQIQSCSRSRPDLKKIRSSRRLNSQSNMVNSRCFDLPSYLQLKYWTFLNKRHHDSNTGHYYYSDLV